VNYAKGYRVRRPLPDAYGASETLKHSPAIICEMRSWATEGVSLAEVELEKAHYRLTKLTSVSPTGHAEGYHVLATRA